MRQNISFTPNAHSRHTCHTIYTPAEGFVESYLFSQVVSHTSPWMLFVKLTLVVTYSTIKNKTERNNASDRK